MTEPRSSDRYRDAVDAEVDALEQDIRHHVVDLEEAFRVRDWAAVAGIYRRVAELADRLELLDPESRARQLNRAEEESSGLLGRGPVELDAAQLEIDAPSIEPDAIDAPHWRRPDPTHHGEESPPWLG